MAGTDGALPRLVDAQAQASDPTRHVWLSASAGTGKTQVLAARVYRLLLRGVDPSAILCLTFTKAGAAEMAGRIGSRLAAWVRMPEEGLRDDLFALGEDPHDDALRKRARSLFARVLDAPGGGLRIQTIHGFAQGLLAAFPLEAGLSPGFRPLEAREEALLARETLAGMLLDAERDGRGQIIDAVGALSLRLGEGEAEKFLKECARAPEAMRALPLRVGDYVRGALELPEGDVEAWVAGECAGFDEAGLRQLAAWNAAWGTKGGLQRADAIAAWLAGGQEQRAASLAVLHEVWAKKDGDPRSFAKGQAPQDPDYADLATGFYDLCSDLLAVRAREGFADLLASGLEAGRDYALAYERAKRRVGAVDFDDLIRATVNLLDQPGMGDWVRYKLDLATEHILIDEAQDTNAQQWLIVRALADEFFATHEPRGRTGRTIFTVGDYKQAIFGFQGTDPVNFHAAEAYFERLATAAGEAEFDVEVPPFTRLSLTQSFRSTLPVLEFVDAALEALPEPGLGTDVELHASAIAGPGEVVLWPPERAEDAEDTGEEGWASDALRNHASRIARRIKGWLDPSDPMMLESKGRALRPEDVMILVKRRGDLASLLVARLYKEGVPVAGVDRLRLDAPLAVRDLLAAMRFALQPEDDLNLANLLVSPLIGWTQDELMERGVRDGVGLWRHLRAAWPETLGALSELLRRADYTTPHRFLEEILSGTMDGRRKLIRRLGEEARDPIEELVSAALQFEDAATPTLQLFLEWFDRGDVDIVRDPSQPLDAVRVMTAHGAKGLQAPLVILADATTDPERSPRSFLAWEPEGNGVKLPIPRPRAGERSGPLADLADEAAARELAEHWRLFYVAATRAEEKLFIGGALGDGNAPPPSSWYAAAERAFAALGIEDEGERQFLGVAPQKPVIAARKDRAAGPAIDPLPGWARAPAPQEARPPRPLAPSSLGEDQVADPPPSAAMRTAAERGRLLHALFECLPAVAPDARHAAAVRWLLGAGGVAEAGVAEAIARDACGVIGDPRFSAVFGPDALAEAPIAAVVGEGLVVAGTVDRLLIEADRVRVIDFKTGRRVPPSLDDVPPYHLRQMAAYAEALAVIFPGRRVEAALLYTGGPALFELPPDLLARHKPGFVPAEQSLPLGG